MERISWTVLAVALLVGAEGGASASPAPGTAQSLVDAERAFARLAATKSTRDAFLAVLDDSGVVYHPTAVNGRRTYQSQPARPGRLAWEPEYAEAAASGDLGYTTGPWSFRAAATDTPTAYGHYVSIWRTGTNGAWRLLLDIGVSHAKPATLTPRPVLHPGRPPVEAASAQSVAAQADSLRAADLRRASSAHDAMARATPDVRVYREGSPVMQGLAAATSRLQEIGGESRRIEDAVVSRGLDLGFTRGLVLRRPDTSGTAADTCSYLRIWRRDGAAWRIALDLEIPARPR